MIIAPIVNSKSEIMIVILRPNRSANGPPKIDPTAAPKVVIDTIVDVYQVVISGQVSLKYNCAPAMTPVSYPNRNPPIVALTVNIDMYPRLYVFSED